MESLLPVIIFVFGAIMGALVAYFFLRSHAAALAGVKQGEWQIKEAGLVERLQGREEQLFLLQGRHDQLGKDLQATRDQLAVEMQERSAAESRNENITRLEATVLQREATIAELQHTLREQGSQITGLQTKIMEERKAAEEKLAMVEQARTHLSDAFKALSSEALKSNNQAFLDLAKTTLEKFQDSARSDLEKREKAITDLVKPVRDSLEKVDGKIHELELARRGAYEKLNHQVQSLHETEKQLRGETARLVQALHAPAVRGRWGEIQLRRVVEMAGMIDHCDFYEQCSITTGDGRLRPDLLVKLPNAKNIVIDAKAPLEAFLGAIECSDETARRSKLKEHAQQIRSHVLKLSQKSYWDAFKPAPEFVVLFLPGESFFSAALEHEPALIEMGVDQKVILATPTTLIALLRAVAYGWQQQNLAQNAQSIADLGRDLYKRVADMSAHFTRLGKNLGLAVESYNSAVGSMENRVLTTARKFKDLQAAPAGVEITELPLIDHAPRTIQAVELAWKAGSITDP